MTNKLLSTFCLIGAATMLYGVPPQTHRYSGEIMDSACAAQGSHAAMMKQEGTTSHKDCTLACVKAGSQLVLYNAANKRTYMLDDQTKATEYAGDKVTVTGSYDAAGKTIHVSKISRKS